MEITAVNIYQDNIISGKNILSINNPLVFLVDVTYTDPPALDVLSTQIKDGAGNVITGNLFSVAYSEPSVGTKRYIFNADQILRSLVEEIYDWLNSTNDILELDPLFENFTIEFIGDAYTDTTNFWALQGSSQFGSSPCKTSIYDIEPLTFIGYEGFWTYNYFFNSTSQKFNLDALSDTVRDAGLYRVKKEYNSIGEFDVNIYIDNLNVGYCRNDVRTFCEGQKLIKYIDRNGMFRFYAFNKFYQDKISTKEIGRTSKLITNILTDQGAKQSLGLTSDKVISLVAENVTNSDLILLEDLFVSPLIYMYIGENGSDTLSDWLLMNIKPGDQVTRIRKGNCSKIEIVLEYPEQYTIKRY